MAKHFTDFSEYPVGAPPSDWTQWINPYSTFEIWDNDTSGGGHGGVVEGTPYLFVNPGDSERRAATWDVVPAMHEGEVYLEFGLANTLDRDVRAAVRLDPNNNTASGDATVVLMGYREDGDGLQFTSYDNGDPTDVQAVVSEPSTLARYCLVVRFSEDDYSAKIWEKGTAEPTAPQLEVTNSDHQEAGLLGLGSFLQGSFLLHAFGAGTGTDSAPRSHDDADQAPSVTLNQSEVAPGDTLTGTARNFASEPTTVTLSDGSSPNYTATPTFTADGDDWSFSATVENFAAQAKSAGEGNPIQGLVPGTITVTVE